MNNELYIIGKGINHQTKLNIHYNRRTMLDYACAVKVIDIIEKRGSLLNDEQLQKLIVLINKLIRYDYRRTLPTS